MGRPRKTKEAAVIESITGLIGLGLFMYFISPGFQSAIQIILLAGVMIVLVAVAIWLLGKLMRDQPSPAFKAIDSETGHAKNTFKYKPPTIEEETRYARQSDRNRPFLKSFGRLTGVNLKNLLN